MAIAVFENVEFTTITALMSAVNNTTGVVQFQSADLDLIFQRKLVAFVANSAWNIFPGAKTPFAYFDIRFNIIQPLNTTQQFTFLSSTPVGGSFAAFNQRIVVFGNNNTISILPVPLKVVSVQLNLHDVASIGNAVEAHLTLFWETKKRAKFIGEK